MKLTSSQPNEDFAVEGYSNVMRMRDNPTCRGLHAQLGLHKLLDVQTVHLSVGVRVGLHEAHQLPTKR